MILSQREKILNLTGEMDSHVYEISKKLKRLGFDDDLDVFWLTELVKQVEEAVNENN